MTTHIAAKNGDIAKLVIMPGDPKRAEHMAHQFLDDPKCINNIRGMLGFTGRYKGKEVTIMASGMGMPSMGIYAYELFKDYGVEEIIRVGSMGAYSEKLNLFDVVLVEEAYTDSSFAKVQNNDERSVIPSNVDLNKRLEKSAKELEINLTRGRIYTSDVFYKGKENYKEIAAAHNCLGVEMEAFALFAIAEFFNKKAACLLTVSDHFVTNEETSPKEREISFSDMFDIALNIERE